VTGEDDGGEVELMLWEDDGGKVELMLWLDSTKHSLVSPSFSKILSQGEEEDDRRSRSPPFPSDAQRL